MPHNFAAAASMSRFGGPNIFTTSKWLIICCISDWCLDNRENSPDLLAATGCFAFYLADSHPGFENVNTNFFVFNTPIYESCDNVPAKTYVVTLSGSGFTIFILVTLGLLSLFACIAANVAVRHFLCLFLYYLWIILYFRHFTDWGRGRQICWCLGSLLR